MKKLIAVLMIMCLAVTAVTSLAEETETEQIVVNWSDYEADAAGIEGDFAHLSQTGLIMFIPAEFKDSEISDEGLDRGTFMVLKNENEGRAIVSGQAAELDMDTFLADLQSQGITIWETVLNGLNCYQFNIEAAGILTSCVAFRTDQDGTIFVFSFTLSDQEPYASLYKVMVSSIQLAE